MTWLETAARLRDRGVSFVIVTVVVVRGHAPRGVGAKMLVTDAEIVGSVGGGNLEQTAIERARTMLAAGSSVPEMLVVGLTERAGGDYGVQCCGGEVSLMLEPMHSLRPQIVVFGAGHVGIALARVLSGLPMDVLLVDSRPEMADSVRLERFDTVANIELRHVNVLYGLEPVLERLRSGALTLVMTHDHLEDIAILEALLGRNDLGFVGLIGSSAKWLNFQLRLRQKGFSETDLTRVTTPIGVPGVRGKQSEVIAIAVAAQLLSILELPEG
jgi:xanthine dehydrogenase accessory factor